MKNVVLSRKETKIDVHMNVDESWVCVTQPIQESSWLRLFCYISILSVYLQNILLEVLVYVSSINYLLFDYEQQEALILLYTDISLYYNESVFLLNSFWVNWLFQMAFTIVILLSLR